MIRDLENREYNYFLIAQKFDLKRRRKLADDLVFVFPLLVLYGVQEEDYFELVEHEFAGYASQHFK